MWVSLSLVSSLCVGGRGVGTFHVARTWGSSMPQPLSLQAEIGSARASTIRTSYTAGLDKAVVEVGQSWPIGQFSTNCRVGPLSGQRWPSLPNFGRDSSNFGQFGPKLGQFWPSSTKWVTCLVELGPYLGSRKSQLDKFGPYLWALPAAVDGIAGGNFRERAASNFSVGTMWRSTRVGALKRSIEGSAGELPEIRRG